MLGYLLAFCVTVADERDQAQISELARRAQAETGETVEIAYGDQGYTGEDAADADTEHRIKLEVVKHSRRKEACAVASSMGNQTKLRLDSTFSPDGA